MLIVLLSVLGAVGVYLVTRELTADRRSALFATAVYLVLPGRIVFLPIASKLERNSATELLINQIYILGALSIGRQENPRRLELVLNTILPATQRVKYFD